MREEEKADLGTQFKGENITYDLIIILSLADKVKAQLFVHARVKVDGRHD